MDIAEIVLSLVYFMLIGWAVHKPFGSDGGILHYTFIGACGSGIAILIENITRLYTTTFLGAIGSCLICSVGVELLIRRIKHRLLVNRMNDDYDCVDED